MQFPTSSLAKLARALVCAGCLSTGLVAHQAAQAADTYTQTRYPVVMVHGMSGFEAIGPIQYFWGIPENLRAGGSVVFTPQVSAMASNEQRGEQLLAQLRQLRAAYGYSKFNLIGHSQGGGTVRYVAAVEPSLVASVTTVGTPHQGSVVADAVKNLTGATGTTPLVAQFVNLLGGAISWMSGKPGLPQDSLGTLASLNTQGAQDFNRRFPQGAPTSPCGQGPAVVNGIRYYSVSGNAVLANAFDPTDWALAASSVFFGATPNDGLVSTCSSHWGTVLRDNYPWNHGDEINQAFGLRGWFSPDPVAFYRSHVNRLKSSGL